MDADRARTFLLALPHVVETSQWGGAVFWVGDRDIGGKMFAILHFDAEGAPITYPVGVERYHTMLEREGFTPAPYMARIFWVAVERWSALRNAEWEQELSMAHTMTLAKLPARLRLSLDLPKVQLRALVAAGRAKRTAQDAAKVAHKDAVKVAKKPLVN